ncbi:unnamed protein product, partial [Rotaria magnacalcarata]
VGQGGYHPPSYASEYHPTSYTSEQYSYSDKGRDEDSYLTKMNNIKKGSNFKPYTGRDYDQ